MNPLDVPLPSTPSSSSLASLTTPELSDSSNTDISNNAVYGSSSERSALSSISLVHSSAGSQRAFSNDDGSVKSNAQGTDDGSPSQPDAARSNTSASSVREVRSSYPKEELDTPFKVKYPPDPFGEEASDTARVWKVYRDEATGNDGMLLDGWNKTLDILLIFSGLFSAVSTAFIIESYKTLQPDYTQYLANAMFTVLNTRNGSGTIDLGLLTLSSPSAHTSSPASVWINGLWFTSLVMSLTVALLCILAKQWLDEYNKRVLSPVQSIRHWVRRHAFLYEGLERWGLPAFISALPVMLHLSLFLFLAGLVVFLWTLSEAIAAWLLLLTGSLFAFYAGSIVMPFKYTACPTATPLLHQIRILWALSVQLTMPLLNRILSGYRAILERFHPPAESAKEEEDDYTKPSKSRKVDDEKPFSLPIKGQVENRLVARRAEELDATALYWLISSSPAPDVVAVAIQAIGGLLPRSGVVQRLHSRDVSRLILEHIKSHYSPGRLVEFQLGNLVRWNKRRIGPANVARYLRSAITLAALDKPANRSWLGEMGRLRVSTYPVVYDMSLLGNIVDVESKYWSHFSKSLGDSFALMLPDIKQLNRDEVGQDGKHQKPYCTQTMLACLDWVPDARFMIHIFRAQRMHMLHPQELALVATRAIQLFERDASLDSLAQEYPAATCLELWSGLLNSRAALSLDDEDVRAVLEDFNRLVARVSSDVSEQPHSSGDVHFPELFALVSSDFMLSRTWKHAELDDIIHVLDVIIRTGDNALWGACAQLVALLHRDFLDKEHGYDSASSDSSSSRAGQAGRYVSDSARELVDLVRSAGDTLPSGHLFPYWELHDPTSFDKTATARVERVVAHTFHTRYVRIWVTEELQDLRDFVTHSPHWHDADASRGPVLLLRPEGAWRSWMLLGQDRVDLVDVSDAIATQLCCLFRRGFDVSAQLDEFLDAEDHVRTLRTVSRSRVKKKTRAKVERILRHCVEMRPEWWIQLRDEIMEDERDDAELVAYVRELDDKLHSWSPCPECLYVTDYHRPLLPTERRGDSQSPPPLASQPPCGLNAVFFLP